jgi:hypothetical protein
VLLTASTCKEWITAAVSSYRKVVVMTGLSAQAAFERETSIGPGVWRVVHAGMFVGVLTTAVIMAATFGLQLGIRSLTCFQ